MKQLGELGGIHHVTAITSSTKKIYSFFTYILGMRLVKKTVNQDDINTYHTFFADDKGSPGTDMTFFEFQGSGPHRRGTDDISRSSFRVPSDAAITYWRQRFEHYDVQHDPVVTRFGHQVLDFEDADGQRYALISDEKDSGVEAGEPWHRGPVPDEYAIVGLGPVYLTVSDFDGIHQALTEVMRMKKIKTDGDFTLYESGPGGNGAGVIVDVDETSAAAVQGYGGVHHVAFRVADREQLDAWIADFKARYLPNSGFVERHYFQSLYTRLYPNLLFEIATDGPGFIDEEESYETLGEALALPPAYKQHRDYVESVVKHVDTVRSNKNIQKEYPDNWSVNEHLRQL